MTVIDAGEPTPEAAKTEAVATRFDEWKIAHGILASHFGDGNFDPYDVIATVKYLRGDE